MATNKVKPCRIPTFGLRVPSIATCSSPENETQTIISEVHVGRSVQHGEKRGYLRYVGTVHFADGIWCGIELTNSVGKHDGAIKGVRYFACPEFRGLMAPVSKVILLEDINTAEVSDGVSSGPYSILCLNSVPGSSQVHSSKRNQQANRDIETTSRALEQSSSHAQAALCRTFIAVEQQKTHHVKNEPENDLRRHVLTEKCLKPPTVLRPPLDIGTNAVLLSNKTSSIENLTSKLVPLKFQSRDVSLSAGNLVIPELGVTNKLSEQHANCETKPKKRSNEANHSKPQDFKYVVIETNRKRRKSSVALNCPSEELLLFGRQNSTPADLNENRQDIRDVLSINQACSTEEIRGEFKFQAPKAHKPNSLPQLRVVHQLHCSPRNSFTDLKQLDCAQHIDVSDDRRAHGDNDSENSKRDSLDCDESLGILTPEQMNDFTQSSFSCPLDWDKIVESSTSDRLVCFVQNPPPINPNNETHCQKLDTLKPDEAQSPNDFSLGIIDPDQMISGFSFLSADTTMNLDLPLDPGTTSQGFFPRCEETPSPEELPLDTTPLVESEPSKTEPTKSKTTSSIITSITSITSLDTGYQGDGEMSRPGSRGADNSPLTRRPYSRPPPRRPDPMTDSDFYTESDADIHDENHLKGDRRAQVIDGTLYGVDPQAAADIYVNNRENMDSSGVFTDLESGLRNDEGDNGNDSGPEHNNNRTANVSPSDSTKTFSGNSQGVVHEPLDNAFSPSHDVDDKMSDKTVKENPKKRMAPSPGVSTPSSLSSPRRIKDENPPKKYKLPKRDVPSKVNSKLVQWTPSAIDKKQAKKPVNKWDAVMTKISKNEQNKTSLKEIKSKVFENLNLRSPTGLSSDTSTNSRAGNTPTNKRRIPTRATHNSIAYKATLSSNLQTSNQSSLSDLSTSVPLSNKTFGSIKGSKKKDPIQVTKVLTSSQLTLKNQRNLTENKKNGSQFSNGLPHTNVKSTHLASPKDKKLQSNISKESTKSSVKGGRTPPSVRPPAQLPTRGSKKTNSAPRTSEALAVLVQHLVFNVGAFQVPQLKKQVEKYRLEVEEVRLARQELEKALSEAKLTHVAAIEEERLKYQKDVADLIERHKHQVSQVTNQQAELQDQLKLAKDLQEQQLKQKHEEQLAKLRKELEKVQKSYDEAVVILREENDCIREQIDENRLKLDQVNLESQKLRDDYETKEGQLRQEVDSLKEQKDKLKQQIARLEVDFQEKLKISEEENKRLREQNDRLLSYGDHKDVAKQEVQSLRVVLELKQNEISELRKSLEELRQRQQILEGAEEKASALQARCEDLQHQLQRKTEYEQTLIQENQKLQDSFKDEINHSKRLSQHNEELQWKLRQNKEIFTKVIKQAEETVFNRTQGVYSSSFSETSGSPQRGFLFKDCSEIAAADKKSAFEGDDDEASPPASPKVKGVVEKSDSVSYVLDLDGSSDLAASRILRRSFRNGSLSKNNTPICSSTKRPKMKNPLATSSSSNALLFSSTSSRECDEESSNSRNGDYEDDDVFLWENRVNKNDRSAPSSLKFGGETLDLDEENEEELQLPALPSEMDKRNGVLALPRPKRLAADSAGSESNSEDESTSSSQL